MVPKGKVIVLLLAAVAAGVVLSFVALASLMLALRAAGDGLGWGFQLQSPLFVSALALLFGLYLVKPSPFCILDEVDAPLDDANCGRFLRMIDRFKGRTQFIIVTHNKLTMEAADALYGVTMEQPGISKLVSVRLNRAGETADETPGLAEPRIAIDTNSETADIDS